MLSLMSGTLLARQFINRVHSVNFRYLRGCSNQAVNVKGNWAIKGLSPVLFETGWDHTELISHRTRNVHARPTTRFFSTAELDINHKENEPSTDYSVLLNRIPFCSKQDIANFLDGVKIKRGHNQGIYFYERKIAGIAHFFALVYVDSLKDLKTAVSRSGHFMQEQYIEVYPYSSAKFWVHLNGLPPHVTVTHVSNFLGNVIVDGGKSGIFILRKSGEAFVRLQSQEDVNSCLENNKQYIGTKYIQVTQADPVIANLTVGNNFSPRKFWVKVIGLPFRATKDDLINFFADVKVEGGPEHGIHMVTHDGVPNGIAYVKLQSKRDMQLCLQKSGEYLGERYLSVVPVDFRRLKEFTRINQKVTTAVRLYGLPFDVKAEEIKYFFEGLDIADDGITIDNQIDPQARGRITSKMYGAVVKFTSTEMALKAMARDRNMIRHRYIRVQPIGKV